VFVVATANDISQLPPELMRKGRLDEIFTWTCRRKKSARRFSRFTSPSAGAFRKSSTSRRWSGTARIFSGAEIEEAVISGLYDAFYTGEELSTAHVLEALRQTVPLSKTMDEQINRLRSWAEGRARNASVPRDAKREALA